MKIVGYMLSYDRLECSRFDRPVGSRRRVDTWVRVSCFNRDSRIGVLNTGITRYAVETPVYDIGDLEPLFGVVKEIAEAFEAYVDMRGPNNPISEWMSDRMVKGGIKLPNSVGVHVTRLRQLSKALKELNL